MTTRERAASQVGGDALAGPDRAEKNMTDSDFVQIAATTHDATGQVLLYALTRAGDVWQFDFNKHRWEILPATRA
jgi:hypothetical protein